MQGPPSPEQVTVHCSKAQALGFSRDLSSQLCPGDVLQERACVWGTSRIVSKELFLSCPSLPSSLKQPELKPTLWWREG